MTTATPIGELEQREEVEEHPDLLHPTPSLRHAREAFVRVGREPRVVLPDEGTGERARRRLERHRLRRQQAIAAVTLATVLLATAVVLVAARVRSPQPASLVRAQTAPNPADIRVDVAGGTAATLSVLAPADVRSVKRALPRPALTEIRYYDRHDEAKARWVREDLGRGTLLFSPRRTGDVDVTVVVGKDLQP